MSTGGYLFSAGGSEAGAVQVFKVAGVNLLATGQTIVVPAQSGKRLVPLFVRIRLASLTGAFVVAPIVRLGNNGTFDNVAPLFTMTSTAVNGVDGLGLVAALTAVDVGSTGISVDVQTAGTVATVATGDVYVVCLLI